MSDRDHARMLLEMAEKDLKALRGMDDTEIFADEVFGFHTQQVIEKALKAWLNHCNIQYPKSHDLEELFALLEQAGKIIPTHFRTLVDLVRPDDGQSAVPNPIKL